MVSLTKKQQYALDKMREGKNVFLTGKAGTGKSFVVNIFREEKSKMLVCAPTGIAALNVDGATLHRAFKLPVDYVEKSYHIYDNNDVAQVVNKTDCLLIDEISMVRADILSHVEYRMRTMSEKSGSAFGGKQIIAVGDFMQLPPVVMDEEKDRIRKDYGGSYAFEAKAWKEAGFELIELDEVVRQADLMFVDALNSVREKNMNASKAVSWINSNATIGKPVDDCVTLCYTNKAAASINEMELARIAYPPVTFQASVSGQIKKSDMPVDEVLTLKIGAKVMCCVNNDNYVNGTVGTVTDINSDFITIDDTIDVYKYKWEIKEPVVENGKLSHKVIGEFKQFPLRHAWAITTHKSQGQTIKGRVHMQMDSKFRPHGSTYVALSRCTDIANLSFERPLGDKDVFVDERVRTAMIAMSGGMTTIEVPSFSIELFQKMIDVMALNPTEQQLNMMMDRLNSWEVNLCR